MLMTQAATMLRDTVFVAQHVTGNQLANGWALAALASIASALAGWALARSVDHGERMRRLETFLGVDGTSGLTKKIDEIDGKVDETREAIHRIANAVQTLAVDTARLQERNTSHIRPGS